MNSSKRMWQCPQCPLLNFVGSSNCKACFYKNPKITNNNNNNKNKNQQGLYLFLEGYMRKIKYLLLSSIPNDVKQVIIDYYKTYIIFGIGANQNYEFGLDDDENVTQWTRLHDFESLLRSNNKNIFGNGRSLIIKTSNNELYVVGANVSGKLGIDSDNKAIQILTKNNFNENSDINMISINYSFMFIQCVNHKLYASGFNQCGGFGNGEIQQMTKGKFVEINNINNWLNVGEYIEDIECASSVTIFLTSNKNVFMAGFNENNEFNINNIDNNKDISTPTLIASNIDIISCGIGHIILLSDIGILKTFYKKVMNKYFHDNNIKIIDIKSGNHHVVCLSDDGKSYCFGTACYGQCGNGDNMDYIIEPYYVNIDVDVKDIECGASHTMLLSQCNKLYMFGDNGFNQCSSLCENDVILKPYLFDKVHELGNNYYIERFIGLDNETIIIIDPYKLV